MGDFYSHYTWHSSVISYSSFQTFLHGLGRFAEQAHVAEHFFDHGHNHGNFLEKLKCPAIR